MYFRISVHMLIVMGVWHLCFAVDSSYVKGTDKINFFCRRARKDAEHNTMCYYLL